MAIVDGHGDNKVVDKVLVTVRSHIYACCDKAVEETMNTNVHGQTVFEIPIYDPNLRMTTNNDNDKASTVRIVAVLSLLQSVPARLSGSHVVFFCFRLKRTETSRVNVLPWSQKWNINKEP